jgi:hypothetical protein
VVKLFPQEHFTVVSVYVGWVSVFMMIPRLDLVVTAEVSSRRTGSACRPRRQRSAPGDAI